MRNPHCTACKLYQNVETVCVYGEGPAQADIMLVGLGPGEKEDRDGRPFVGKAGGVLDECIEEAGLERKNLYLTNTVKCRPPENKVGPMELRTCASLYLVEELKTVKPLIVVCLGDVAARAMCGLTFSGRVGDYAGKGRVLAGDILDTPTWCLITYHPSAYLRSGSNAVRGALVADLAYAKQYTQEMRANAPA